MWPKPVQPLTKRMPILRSMSGEAICILMSEGNRSVYNLLRLAWHVDPNILLTLDDCGMRGAQIYHACFGFCGGLFPKFRTCVMSRDQEMLNFVNQKVPELKAGKDKLSTKIP